MLLNRHLRSIYVDIKYGIPIVRSYCNLGINMKKLNDRKEFKQALELFHKYEHKNSEIISDVAINQALKSFTNMEDFQGGSDIYQRYLCRIEKNCFTLASIIHFYMQSGNVNRAQEIFNKSKQKTMGIYGAMMKGLIKNDMLNETVHLFFQIPNPDEIIFVLFFHACARIGTEEALRLAKKVLSNLPNSYRENSNILTTAFDAFIKCGDLLFAEKLLPKIKKISMSYGNLMKAYNKNNQPEKTLDLYEQMKFDKIEPDVICYLLLVNACSNIGILSICQSIFEQIPKSFLDNSYIKNALVDMWGKSSCIDRAENIFQSLIQPDTIGYTSMINSYGLNGMGIQAIELFNQMPRKLILEETYVCVLNACSHSGLIDQARSIFSNITNKTEKIYATMVDCLSRSFLFEEAQELIDNYESYHSPSPTMLTALLSSARNRRDRHLSEKIFNRIQENFPELKNRLISASILLSNVYASTGDVDKSSNIKNNLYQLGLKKKIGLSWTAINGRLFKFRAHDQSHPQSSKIYAEVEKISQELIEYGHQYDSSWITRPLEQDETVASVLCGHSERLAIAWNFVVNPNTTKIQITKNLRVCGDCHQATKLIASIRQCEIIVRDTNRIHHFCKNGQCSCNDYF
ncbi:unnamed protein product [Rotaria socialis]|uniref:DYW domain-containing protein n=1 Tax=Rotaria socialis TaxID=392032 RepID=A0A818IN21_9BILA|nr:unnamed protein product [Rotaria socialis]